MAELTNKILFVDDEPDITYIVEFVLASAGFEVNLLNDSTQAVDELLSKDYRLLILDLMMPKMDGFSVLRNLRGEGRLADLPVLILSSRQLSNEETKYLRSMKAEVMAKPFETHRLLEKVRDIIED